MFSDIETFTSDLSFKTTWFDFIKREGGGKWRFCPGLGLEEHKIDHCYMPKSIQF